MLLYASVQVAITHAHALPNNDAHVMDPCTCAYARSVTLGHAGPKFTCVHVLDVILKCAWPPPTLA